MRKLQLLSIILLFTACETVKQKEVHKIAEIFPKATYMDGSMLQMLGDHNYMVAPNGGGLADCKYMFRFDVDGNLVDTVNLNEENRHKESSNPIKNEKSSPPVVKQKPAKKSLPTLEEQLRPQPVK